MSHVSNEPLTTSAASSVSPSLLRNEVDQRIVKIRPMSTPLDQISRCAGSRSASSMEVEFYSVASKDTESELSEAVAAPKRTAGQPCVTVTIKVNNAEIFDPTETILFPSATYTVGGKVRGCVSGYVVERTGETLKVMLQNFSSDGVAAVTEMPAGTKVVRMGRAATELAVQTPQFEALPTKDSNYCQIFKMQVEQSTLMKLANKEVGWDFTDQEEVAIIDMRLGMEKNFLFGMKSRISHPDTHEDIFLTGGIWNQAPRSFFYTKDAVSNDTVVSLCRQAFTRNCGSHRKILIAGTGLVDALSRIEGMKIVAGNNPLVKWGLEFHEIVSNFGRLYVIHSEIFDQCGHADDGFVLDPEYLTKYSHIPFRTDRLDLRGAGLRNTDATVITEASCLVLRYPDAHLRVIGQ